MTVFFALLLSIIIPFCGIFTDLIRLETSRSMQERNLDNAIMSVLSDYDGRLFDQYGLFGLYERDKNAVKDKLAKYIKQNMAGPDSPFYKNELLELNCNYKYFDLDSLKKQIIAYARFRVPGEKAIDLIRSIIDTFDIEFIKKTQDMEADISKYDDRISELCRYYDQIIEMINDFANRIKGCSPDEIKNMADDYLQQLDEAECSLKNLYDISSDTREKIRDMELKLAEVSKEKEIYQSYYIKKLGERLKKLQDKLLDKTFFNTNMEVLKRNRQQLRDILSSRQKNNEDIEQYRKRLEFYGSAFMPLTASGHRDADFSAAYEKYDNRKEQLASFNNILKDMNEEKSKEITAEEKVQLPSFKLNVSDWENSPNTWQESASLDDEQFSKDIMAEGERILSGIIGSLEKLYEEVLINEYILTCFKCAVLKEHEGKEITDFKGRSLFDRESYLDNEVEYIISGGSRDSDNMLAIKAYIFCLRFCMNTLHVYSDMEKKTLARAAALAVTALTGGTGAGLVSHFILWGWSLGESCIDISDLLKGKKVPIYKSKEEWKLDIGQPVNNKEKKSSISIGYRDYLRLLLLMVPMEIKLARIADLLQLNFRLRDEKYSIMETITGIRASVLLSEEIFFPLTFVYPPTLLTEKGRFRIYAERHGEYK